MKRWLSDGEKLNVNSIHLSNFLRNIFFYLINYFICRNVKGVLSNKVLRNFSLLSHLSLSCTIDYNFDNLLNGIPPREVRWSEIALHVPTVHLSQVMYALNASVVGLCKVPEDWVSKLKIKKFYFCIIM